jgi:hypothetical protein
LTAGPGDRSCSSAALLVEGKARPPQSLAEPVDRLGAAHHPGRAMEGPVG